MSRTDARFTVEQARLMLPQEEWVCNIKLQKLEHRYSKYSLHDAGLAHALMQGKQLEYFDHVSPSSTKSQSIGVIHGLVLLLLI